MTNDTFQRPGARSVVHTETSPVFLLGHGSSGTSIAATLLRDFLQIGFGTETQFIPRVEAALPMYGDLRDDSNLRRLVSSILRERFFQRSKKFGFNPTVESVMSRVTQRNYRGVLDAILGELAETQGMTRMGDKTPDYVEHLDVLERHFPDSRYLHIVRDGRDVALSVFGRFWGAKNTVVAALEWRRAIELVRSFESRIGQDRILTFRYEDLLQKPVETFSRLIEFLRIEDPDGSLLESIRDNAPAKIRSDNFDKWRKSMPPAQIARFESITGDLLSTYGYDCQTTVPRLPNAFERMYWSIDSRVRQLFWRDYWLDNVYHAKLRFNRIREWLAR